MSHARLLTEERHSPASCDSMETQISDDDLVISAQCGDKQAFAELCRRHSLLARARIFRIVQNQEDADDILQDTLMRAYVHLASFRRSCKFSTWITTIAVNSALMMLRKRRIRQETQTGLSEDGAAEVWEPIDDSPGPERICQNRQTTLLIRREMQKLRPSLCAIVNHYYQSDDSLEKSANALGISVAAAKSRLMRGRVTLRSRLARYGIINAAT